MLEIGERLYFKYSFHFKANNQNSGGNNKHDYKFRH